MSKHRNAPQLAVTPIYGADSYSRDMSRAAVVMSSSISRASVGPGIIPERHFSYAYRPPMQNFRGLTRAIVKPRGARHEATASLPAANSLVDPVMLALSAGQISGGI